MNFSLINGSYHEKILLEKMPRLDAYDKTAFSQIVSEHIKSFQAAVDNRYLVGDSALFTPSSIQALAEAKSLFVTRVPSQIKAVGEYISTSPLKQMVDLGNGYLGQEYVTTYADVAQRWIVIFSKAAYERECRTLIKHCKKGSEKEAKAFSNRINQNRLNRSQPEPRSANISEAPQQFL